MSKRTTTGSHDAIPRHYWPTPPEADVPLLPRLATGTRFVEPCAGDGRLSRHLEAVGHICAAACDIEPRGPGIRPLDARLLICRDLRGAEALVTAMLDRSLTLGAADVWVICPLDLIANRWWTDYAAVTVEIVPVGRVRCIDGSPHSGMENTVWLRLDPARRPGFLHPRLAQSGTTQTRNPAGRTRTLAGSETYASNEADSISASQTKKGRPVAEPPL